MAVNLHRRLYRSRGDRVLAGVAGGMAEYLGIDPTIVRILWVLAFLPGGVPGFLLYMLCWLLIPSEPWGMRSWD
jgi:phage shock protein C